MTFYLSIQSVLYSRFWKDLSEDSITSKFTFIQIPQIYISSNLSFVAGFFFLLGFITRKTAVLGLALGGEFLVPDPVEIDHFPLSAKDSTANVRNRAP